MRFLTVERIFDGIVRRGLPLVEAVKYLRSELSGIALFRNFQLKRSKRLGKYACQVQLSGVIWPLPEWNHKPTTPSARTSKRFVLQRDTQPPFHPLCFHLAWLWAFPEAYRRWWCPSPEERFVLEDACVVVGRLLNNGWDADIEWSIIGA